MHDWYFQRTAVKQDMQSLRQGNEPDCLGIETTNGRRSQGDEVSGSPLFD